MNSLLQYARIPPMERYNSSPEFQECSQLLELLRRSRTDVSPNENIWDFLVENISARMDVYKRVNWGLLTTFVHPTKDESTNLINFDTLDLAVSIYAGERDEYLFASLKANPTRAVLFTSTEIGFKPSLHKFKGEIWLPTKEKVDPSLWGKYRKFLS